MTKQRNPPENPPPSDLSYIADPLRPLAERIDLLRPDPENARAHDEQNIRAIAASLRQYGQRKPIVVNSATKCIEAGNGTYEAAKRIGWTHLAVVWVQDDPAAARGFSVADNRTAEMSAWDPIRIETLLAEIAEDSDSSAIYEELRLAELRKSLVEAAVENKQTVADNPIEERWAVVVECSDESDQKTIYERLTKEGRSCRPLTL